jgi:hypothetical protein
VSQSRTIAALRLLLPRAPLVFIVLLLLAFSACRPAASAAQPITTLTATAAPTETAIAVDLDGVLSALAAAPGWSPADDARFYNRENLFDLMNGQSDSFFVYGFERAGLRRFTHTSAPEVEVMVTIFEVSTPPGAYGLFTANGSGSTLEIGSGAHAKPGERLCFWQSRYYVQIIALKPIAQDDLLAAAQTISAQLPTGGEIPEIVTLLPEKGEYTRFFYEELSIQDYVWLGGENILGLGPDTPGALARYALPGGDGWLVLIAYPDAQRAQAGRQAIQAADLPDLAAFDLQGERLAAVFGPVDASAAAALVDAAFEPYR